MIVMSEKAGSHQRVNVESVITITYVDRPKPSAIKDVRHNGEHCPLCPGGEWPPSVVVSHGAARPLLAG